MNIKNMISRIIDKSKPKTNESTAQIEPLDPSTLNGYGSKAFEIIICNLNRFTNAGLDLTEVKKQEAISENSTDTTRFIFTSKSGIRVTITVADDVGWNRMEVSDPSRDQDFFSIRPGFFSVEVYLKHKNRAAEFSELFQMDGPRLGEAIEKYLSMIEFDFQRIIDGSEWEYFYDETLSHYK